MIRRYRYENPTNAAFNILPGLFFKVSVKCIDTTLEIWPVMVCVKRLYYQIMKVGHLLTTRLLCSSNTSVSFLLNLTGLDKALKKVLASLAFRIITSCF
jgi:ABC-type uncharacterized transport system permease subunit